MFDSDFAKAALKEYGPPIILLAAIFVLKQIGLLNNLSFSNSLNTGTFFSGVILIIITFMAYFQIILKTLKSGSDIYVNDISDNIKDTLNKVTESYNIIHKQSSQTDQIHYLLMNIYDTIKGIPNKKLIYENLIIRTRYLLNDGLEIILEYTLTTTTPLVSNTTIRIQNKLERQLTKLKIDYIDSIVKISKNLLNVESKTTIDSLLDKFFTVLYETTTSEILELEAILFKINSDLKDLEENLKLIFKNQLNLDSDSHAAADYLA